MEHPYLYFTKSNIADFKEKMKNDAGAAARYAQAVKDVPALLEEPFVTEDYANGRDSLHGNFWDLGRQTNQMAKALGLKYLFEGDVACAEKLKALLGHFTAFSRWHAESYLNRTPVAWHSDLTSTGMTLAAAFVYDIIYDCLTPAQREEYARGIYALGVAPAMQDWVFPETRIHAVDSMGHNWWAVCIAEPATALLALKDDLPQVDVNRVLDQANHALAAYFTYAGNNLFNKYRNFDEKGLFYESIGYFEYGTGTPLRYLWCYERVFGDNRVLRDAIPANMGDAYMQFSYPYTEDGKTEFAFLNFGDSDFWGKRDFLVKQLRRNGYDSAPLRALSDTLAPDISDEIEGYTPACGGGDVSALPKTAVFPSGYVIHRSSWEPNATVLAVKSGYCWNHSHNDSGHFTLVHKGSPLLIDCGRCDYDNPLYHPYYCQDAAHNVLTVGGEGRRHEELYRGTKFNGKITEVKEGRDFLFVQADCTGPMAHLCSRMFRNYFWLDESVLVIVDEIFCHGENTAEFTLHYAGECTPHNGTYVITDGERQATLTPIYPLGMQFSQKQGHPEREPEKTVPYIQLQTPEKARAHMLIHTVTLDGATVKTELLQGKNTVGVQITRGDKVRRIAFNQMADGHIMHDNSNNTLLGYDTDAYLLMVTENKKENTQEVLSVCASYLRQNSRVLFADFVKSTGLYK